VATWQALRDQGLDTAGAAEAVSRMLSEAMATAGRRP
jgi:hypothetical protein